MKMKTQKSVMTNQQGFAAIIVVIILMTILSLITLAFIQLMNRESRQALDRQLSTQAYYAAEAGVNDAIKAASTAAFSAAYPTGAKTDCTNNDAVFGPHQLGGIAYSCLLVNNSPTVLQYSPVAVDKTIIVPLTTAIPASKIKISWQDVDNGTSFAGPVPALAFPTTGVWGGKTGVLRIDLSPVTNSGTVGQPLDRDSLINYNLPLFLYPSRCPVAGSCASGAVPYTTSPPAPSSTDKGAIIDGKCDTAHSSSQPKYCNVEITSLPGATSYFLRLHSVYKNSSVSITAYDSSSNPMGISGAQIEVDSTGRAIDQVKRIKVSVPINNGYAFPQYGLETSDSICKRLYVAPNYAKTDVGNWTTASDPCSGL